VIKLLVLAYVVICFLVGANTFVFANNGQNFVDKRFHCRSAEKPDVGEQDISADGPTCAASRQAIQSRVQSLGGDPCHSFDQDWSLNGSEEIQVSGCPRQ